MLRTIDVAGVRYRVSDEGTGPVLLLVHGFPLDHTMWKAQIDEFSKTHRVIAPDLRGFGGSDGHLYSVSMAQFADDLADLLEGLNADRPITFCGLSMGGYIAFQFALRHPRWLSRLILCDTRAAADAPEAAANRLKMADIVTKQGPEPVVWAMMPKLFAPQSAQQRPALVDEVRSTVMATSPVAIAAAHRGMAIREDMTGMLPNLHLPTLVIVGEQDLITPAAEMKSVAEALPNARYEQIPDAGHMAPMENPVAVNQAIRRFLRD
ncbi:MULTISPECIES: alpha/beta fold hydrolase [unclassified Schlesneria]|uniref:alpha/beta fold hydrolase n=1 Tax=Schlesneria TaxID=656899 RepID=UPI002F088B99